MTLLIAVVKTVIGELGGLRYVLVLSLILAMAVPLLVLYSTATLLGESIPPAPLLHAEVYRAIIVFGNSSIEGYLACYSTSEEMAAIEGVRLASSVGEGVVLPRVYEGVKRIGDSITVALPSSTIQTQVQGFYSVGENRFILVSGVCPRSSTVDGNRVIFNSLIEEIRGLVAMVAIYIHFSAALTLWLQMRKRSEALKRALFTLRSLGVHLYSYPILTSSLLASLIITVLALSLGVATMQIVVNVLAHTLNTSLFTPFMEPLTLTYTFTSLLTTTWLTLSIGLLMIGREVGGGSRIYENT